MGNGWIALAGCGVSRETLTRWCERLASEADSVLVDTYTMPGSEWILEALGNIAPGRTVEASRKDLEDNAHLLVDRALHGEKLLIAVPGDPLVATTHRSILWLASKKGVRTLVAPGVSGVCAAKSLSHLDYYKYGRTITIPGPWRNVKPYSIVEYVYANICAGLHTLALIDLSPAGGQLDPCSAVETLCRTLGEMGPPFSVCDKPALLVERAGMPGWRTMLLPRLSDTCRVEDWRAPYSIVIPGVPGRIEIELLEELAYAPYGLPPKHAWLEPGMQAEACKFYSGLLAER